jgi:acyl carrier protein
MTNKQKYDAAFIETFGVTVDSLNEQFVYQCIPEWDSVGHMGLIAALEDAFGVMMETEDIIEFGSYTIGIKTLEKYGIDFSK